MKNPTSFFLLVLVCVHSFPHPAPLASQVAPEFTLTPAEFPLLLDEAEWDAAMTTPPCLDGFEAPPNTRGVPVDAPEGVSPDGTYLVKGMQFDSDGFLINGWLYLPTEGDHFPLVILTNGGGNDARAIKSLANFLAPRLAYCGVAAFVHDKRGTGASEGVFRETDYEDYITDTGNAGIFLSSNPLLDPERIGVMGGSEGGRIAVVAAARYPVFSFVVSLMGPTNSMVEDRLVAEKYANIGRGLNGVAWEDIEPIWRGLMEAEATGDPAVVAKFDEEIVAARERFPSRVLPFTNRANRRGEIADRLRPTYASLKYDYVTVMEGFRKPWLALYGEEDTVVLTEPNVREIHRTTALSGNPDVSILVFPRIGHAPVDRETGRRVLLENPILNWMQERGLLRMEGGRSGHE
jgi:pimeloyl-ACP methyl ester carboxylesterase